MFYVPDIDSLTLSEEESQHCVRVLRATRGDEIQLTDGRGTFYTARITNPHPKHCEFEIAASSPEPRHHRGYVHLAFAPTKNIDRIEWMLEKCTEIGADEYTPLLCRFSERKQLRADRLEKIILSATKQSLSAYLPVLNPLTDCCTFIRSVEADYKFIAHCYREDERRLLRDEIQRMAAAMPEARVVVLIGPEGDFSPEEVETAIACGFVPVSLGDMRLRTETAGLVAVHTAVLLNS